MLAASIFFLNLLAEEPKWKSAMLPDLVCKKWRLYVQGQSNTVPVTPRQYGVYEKRHSPAFTSGIKAIKCKLAAKNIAYNFKPVTLVEGGIQYPEFRLDLKDQSLEQGKMVQKLLSHRIKESAKGSVVYCLEREKPRKASGRKPGGEPRGKPKVEK